MNVHDSEKMAGVLRARGCAITEDSGEADLIIFNTCSIREKAEQKFLSELGKVKSLKRQRPGLKVAVAGCIAQQMGEGLLRRAPHVDYVIGPQNIHVLGDIGRGSPRAAVGENPLVAETDLPALRKEKGRAWVSIMYGCDNFCTYCIVPFTRGRETSRPWEGIMREVEGLSREGFKEVTLLGQNVNSYRGDTDFPGLLGKINSVEGIERIRFVTSHPRDLSEALIEGIAGLGKVCEHIHLPLQSGSTRVLGLMNRGYSLEDYLKKVERLREMVPGIAITSDIIAGFPTETEEDHQETMRALRDIRFDGIFAFKFSRRPGTAASEMKGQLPEEVKLRRLREILALQDDITLQKNRPLEGASEEVLVEGPSETDRALLTGRTRTNKIVNFPFPDAPHREVNMNEQGLINRLIRVRILRARRHSLDGEILDPFYEG
jgi:tRNA-2-methylthio-N6-dimethylallyladenosine synthase